MADEEVASAFSSKDLVTIVPIVGIVLAALFDFGVFASADASLYTLFSWSDHIVFASEALFPAILILSALAWSLKGFTFDFPMNKQPGTKLWLLVIAFGIGGVASLLSKGYGVFVFWILMLLIAFAAMFLKVWLSGIILSYSLALLFGAYALGYTRGLSDRRWPANQVVVTAKGEMHGRVFRSGERGVLFYEASTNKMGFLLWSEIKRLDTDLTNAPYASSAR